MAVMGLQKSLGAAGGGWAGRHDPWRGSSASAEKSSAWEAPGLSAAP